MGLCSMCSNDVASFLKKLNLAHCVIYVNAYLHVYSQLLRLTGGNWFCCIWLGFAFSAATKTTRNSHLRWAGVQFVARTFATVTFKPILRSSMKSNRPDVMFQENSQGMRPSFHWPSSAAAKLIVVKRKLQTSKSEHSHEIEKQIEGIFSGGVRSNTFPIIPPHSVPSLRLFFAIQRSKNDP